MASDLLYIYKNIPCQKILSSLEDKRRNRLQMSSAVLFENCIPIVKPNNPPSRTKEYVQQLNPLVENSIYESVITKKRRGKTLPFKPPSTNNLYFLWDFCVKYACSTRVSYFIDEDAGSSFMDEKVFHCSEIVFTKDSEEIEMAGINSDFFYYGTAGSHTPLHIEDFNLDSINIHLYGEPKLVMLIHESERQTSLRKLLSSSFQTEDNMFDLKRAIVTTEWLKKNEINFTLFLQKSGSAIVYGAGTIHCVFNLGENKAVARNFGSKKWYAKRYAFTSTSKIIQDNTEIILKQDTDYLISDVIINEIKNIYKCVKCGYKTTTKKNLSTHYTQRHYCCKKCVEQLKEKAMFTSQVKLQEHEVEHHSKICSSCNIVIVRGHSHRCFSQKQRNFRCPFCPDKAYYTKRDLNKHNSRKHPSPHTEKTATKKHSVNMKNTSTNQDKKRKQHLRRKSTNISKKSKFIAIKQRSGKKKDNESLKNVSIIMPGDDMERETVSEIDNAMCELQQPSTSKTAEVIVGSQIYENISSSEDETRDENFQEKIVSILPWKTQLIIESNGCAVTPGDDMERETVSVIDNAMCELQQPSTSKTAEVIVGSQIYENISSSEDEIHDENFQEKIVSILPWKTQLIIENHGCAANLKLTRESEKQSICDLVGVNQLDTSSETTEIYSISEMNEDLDFPIDIDNPIYNENIFQENIQLTDGSDDPYIEALNYLKYMDTYLKSVINKSR